MTNQHVVRTISRVGIPIILYPTNKTISTQNNCQTSHDIVLGQVIIFIPPITIIFIRLRSNAWALL